jgi:hypothetical protein
VNGRAILLWQNRSMHAFACFSLPKEDCLVIRKPHICFPSINTSCSSCHSNSIDSTFILHDMHRNLDMPGKRKRICQYNSCTCSILISSSAHGFVVPVPSHHQASTEDEGHDSIFLTCSSWTF